MTELTLKDPVIVVDMVDGDPFVWVPQAERASADWGLILADIIHVIAEINNFDTADLLDSIADEIESPTSILQEVGRDA